MKEDVPLSRALQVGPPTSLVLATCVSADGKPNIITLGMYMPISRRPPLVTIGVSPRRHSHKLIEETGEFVINVPSENLVKETVFCGSVSGGDHDKFAEAELTPIPATTVRPPLIKECISNLECKAMASYKCGDHTLYVGEIVAAHVEEGLLKETLDVKKARTLSHKGADYFIPKLIFTEQQSDYPRI